MALPLLREYWRRQRKALWQLLSGVSSEASVGTALAQALCQPLAHHVQQYVFLLLSLGDTIGEVSSRDCQGAGCCSRGLLLAGKPKEERHRALAWGTH